MPTKLKTNEKMIFSGSLIPEDLLAKDALSAGNFFHKKKEDGLEESILKQSLMTQWIRISLQEVRNAQTLKDVRNAWKDAAPCVKVVALEKMLELTTDEKEILNIFNSAPHDSIVRHLSYDKLKDLGFA